MDSVRPGPCLPTEASRAIPALLYQAYCGQYLSPDGDGGDAVVDGEAVVDGNAVDVVGQRTLCPTVLEADVALVPTLLW